MDGEQARAIKLESELREELGRVMLPMDGSDHDALRSVVCDYVLELRSLDWPPERVIKTVKEIAHEVGFHQSTRHDVLPGDWTDADRFLSDLVGWSITQYYETGPE